MHSGNKRSALVLEQPSSQCLQDTCIYCMNQVIYTSVRQEELCISFLMTHGLQNTHDHRGVGVHSFVSTPVTQVDTTSSH